MPGEKYSSIQVGGSRWRQLVMNRARQISDRVENIISNDFEADSASSENILGITCTITYDTGETGGAARMKTGALPGSCGLYNAGGAALVGSPLNESWFVNVRAWIRNTTVSTTSFYCVGMQDSPTGPAANISLGMFGAYSTEFLTLIMNLSGGAVASFVSTMPADIGMWHDYAIGHDYEGQKLYAMVDDTRILELDGAFADLTPDPCYSFTAVNESAVLGRDIELWADNIATVVGRS